MVSASPQFYVFPYREEEQVDDPIKGTSRRTLRPTLIAEVAHDDLSYRVKAFFDVDWEDIRLGVLGHRGFLDHCIVSFHASANYFVVESIDEWERRIPPAPDPFEDFLKRGDPEWDRPQRD